MTLIAIVVAVAENGVIGRDNALAWRLRSDLRRFRELTWGKPMIMGRRTWQSIGKPLPGRKTIVLTRECGYEAPGAAVAHSWIEAKRLADEAAGDMKAGEVSVVGGAEVYRLALPETDIIYLTRVHASPDGDTRFPTFDPATFAEVARDDCPAGPDDQYPYTFLTLARRAPVRGNVPSG